MEFAVPIYFNQTFNPKGLLKNGHVQTLYPNLFRKVVLPSKRIRVDLKDLDFIDIDYYPVQSKKLLILTHGLEGNSKAQYTCGMARAFMSQHFDVIAWNMRSCSGELNRTQKFYHSASIEDMEEVINWALSNKDYEEIHVAGFSLGANVTANFLAHSAPKYNGKIKAGILISAPCDLKTSIANLQRPAYKLYREQFLYTMRKKVIAKHKQLGMPNFSINQVRKIKTFVEFDDLFTAPLHGYKDALDYYEKASSRPHLYKIEVPTLVLNSKDDPFLTKDCFPYEVAKKSKHIHLEITKHGGHLGFLENFDIAGLTYSEKRALQFIKALELNQKIDLENLARNLLSA